MKLDLEQFKEGRRMAEHNLSPEQSRVRIRIQEAIQRCDLAKLEAECRTTRETIEKLNLK